MINASKRKIPSNATDHFRRFQPMDAFPFKCTSNSATPQQKKAILQLTGYVKAVRQYKQRKDSAFAEQNRVLSSQLASVAGVYPVVTGIYEKAPSTQGISKAVDSLRTVLHFGVQGHQTVEKLLRTVARETPSQKLKNKVGEVLSS